MPLPKHNPSCFVHSTAKMPNSQFAANYNTRLDYHLLFVWKNIYHSRAIPNANRSITTINYSYLITFWRWPHIQKRVSIQLDSVTCLLGWQRLHLSFFHLSQSYKQKKMSLQNVPRIIKLSSKLAWLSIRSWLFCIQHLPYLVSYWCIIRR